MLAFLCLCLDLAVMAKGELRGLKIISGFGLYEDKVLLAAIHHEALTEAAFLAPF